MKSTSRTEVLNKLKTYKYLKMSLAVTKDSKETERIKRKMQVIEKAIETVSEKYSAIEGSVLYNAYIKDMSLKEIAARYNKSYDSIKHYHSFAIKKLVDNKIL